MKQKKKALLFGVCVFVFLLCFFCVKTEAEEMIRIDANKKYKGMNASFARGYVPSIKKNMMQLIVPFKTGAKLKNESILVGVSFEREENSPFYFKNYQKQVKRSKKGICLYKCKIKLRKDRINGQYPLHLQVLAETEEEMIQQEFIVYIEITDGRAAVVNEELYPPKDAPPEPASENRKEEVFHQPRIIFVKNNLQKESLTAGEEAAWELSAKNCSKDQTVENVKVTLLAESSDIVFEKNVWYFDRIAAGGVMDLSQNISALRKAAEASVPVSFQFDYEDKRGEAYAFTESTRLSIRQVQQAKLAGVSMPESFYEADTDFLTFQVQNTGLSVLYNANVSLKGNGLFAKEVFLGNMEAGTSVDGEMQIFAGTLNMNEQGEVFDENAEKYGDVSAEVLLYYENEQGEVTVQKQEFATVIKKPQVVELEIEEEKPETNQWWITIAGMTGLVFILMIIWLWMRMKYYKKMGREIYERTKCV